MDVLSHETARRAERWLDQGFGSCVLADPQAAAIVLDSMHKFDNDWYELGAHVIMPNHVHLLIRPLQPAENPLETILKSWKSWTSREIHAKVGGDGTLWQQESFDRIVRDGEHLYRCIQYIGRNPENAGLSRMGCHCWLRPEWERLEWSFETKS
ncbi:MAG: hypothetical protein JWM11_3806 [Planctomycetaceae bacterium]|nr:hypothetical protein [Planctomycetaceae bacterium]